MMVRTGLVACMLVLIGCAHQSPVVGQDIARLKDGVVRVTSMEKGSTRVGTGFVVKFDPEVVYIVTAAHVVGSDPQQKVQFFSRQEVQVRAHVKHVESGDEVTGMALLIVSGRENIPTGFAALSLAPSTRVSGGDDIMVIGHPLGADWAVIKGSIASRKGRYLTINANIDAGSSGGPFIHSGQVVGLIGGVQRYGIGVTIGAVREYLEGHGVLLEEGTPPSIANISPLEQPTPKAAREIIGENAGPPMIVAIPAGEFWMGSQDNEGDKSEHPRHRVALAAFFLDKYEVTNRLFQQFVQQTGHRTTAEQQGSAAAFVEGKWEYVKGASWRKPEAGTTVFDSNRAEHPVVSVSWDDAQAYCRWLGKRLPTEAEFEYATRAGTETEYWWGNGNPGLRRVANIADESAKRQHSDWPIMTGYDDGYVHTAPVGSFEANPFGLYDMTGNVYEWTADWYDEQYYSVSPQRDPKGPSNGENRVVRSGSWKCPPNCVRSAYRHRGAPTTRTVYIGFRCAQDVPK